MDDNDARRDTTDRSHDTTPTVSVAEAARRLGITDDAVRARIRRGTLRGEKVGAVWRVRLPTGATPEPARHDTTDRRATRRDPEPDDLVEQLRSEVDYLREQLATTIRQLAAERERADTLMYRSLERIESLSASVRDEPDDQDAGQGGGDLGESAGLWARIRRWWNG
jgi:excisionase family DNA binding protein